MLRQLRRLIGRLRQREISAPFLGEQDAAVTAPDGRLLSRSAFNPLWMGELGLDPRVIVDVGSFDGGDALRLSQAFPAARVVSIEADPRRFELLRNALSPTDVTLIHAAIQGKDGAVPFFRTSIAGEASAQGSLFRFTDQAAADLPHIHQNATADTVPGRRLDSLMRELGLPSIDLLHMDAQGAELEVLRSMSALRPRVVYLEVDAEYVGAPRAGDIHAFMTAHRYHLVADFGTDRLYKLI
jgi:FkbM family methyltransferase